MNLISILGTVAGAAENVLQVANKHGSVKDVATQVAAGALVVATKSPEAQQQVLDAVKHLEGTGALKNALAAHLPHLPANYLAAILGLVEGLTAAYENDGKLDAGEIMGIVAAAVQELS